jgi:phage baseplate assembly protein W
MQLPFTLNGSGAVADTSDPEKIWEYRVKSALGTSLGERLLRPTYGVSISDIEFNTESMAREILTREIESAFANNLENLSLDTVDFSFDASLGVLNVTVGYFLPSNNLVETTMGIASISGSSPISEA